VSRTLSILLYQIQYAIAGRVKRFPRLPIRPSVVYPLRLLTRKQKIMEYPKINANVRQGKIKLNGVPILNLKVNVKVAEHQNLYKKHVTYRRPTSILVADQFACRLIIYVLVSLYFFTRDAMCAERVLAIVVLSVRLLVCHDRYDSSLGEIEIRGFHHKIG